MAEYEYNTLNPKWKPEILYIKLLRLYGLKPPTNFIVGISIGPEKTVIGFSRDLTAEEKAKLDEFMSKPNVGLIPPEPLGTIFQIEDLSQFWRLLQDLIGVEIAYVFPPLPETDDKYEVWFVEELPKRIKDECLDFWSGLIKEKA